METPNLGLGDPKPRLRLEEPKFRLGYRVGALGSPLFVYIG